MTKGTSGRVRGRCMRLCSYAWSSAPPAMRRVRWLLTLVFFVLGTIAVRPGSLLSVNPTGASPGVVINLTGTGFNTTAASNAVTFTPEGAGPALTVPAISVVTVNATTGTRRLGVRVPAGLPVGRVSLTVTNTGTGETASGASVDVVTITLPEVASAATGAQGVNVRILGSANANFGTGTRPVFGAGITVTGLIIESPTSLRA